MLVMVVEDLESVVVLLMVVGVHVIGSVVFFLSNGG